MHNGNKQINDNPYLGQYVIGLANTRVKIFPKHGINNIKYLGTLFTNAKTIIPNAIHKHRATAGIGVDSEKTPCDSSLLLLLTLIW